MFNRSMDFKIGMILLNSRALLLCLDKAVTENPEKVGAAVADPHYMNSLVELQWKRGSTGGEKFARLLKKIAGIDEVMETSKEPPKPTYVVRPQMPEAFTMTPRAKLGKPKAVAVPISSVESVDKKPLIEPVPSMSESEELIRNLCKELLATVNLSPKRRSSAPADDSTAGETTAGLGQRRHSSFGEEAALKDDVGRNVEGPLIDQIMELEPCIVKSALDVQIPLLFERTPNPLNARPLLLNVLAHQSSWKTVDFCINFFLSECDSK